MQCKGQENHEGAPCRTPITRPQSSLLSTIHIYFLLNMMQLPASPTGLPAQSPSPGTINPPPSTTPLSALQPFLGVMQSPVQHDPSMRLTTRVGSTPSPTPHVLGLWLWSPETLCQHKPCGISCYSAPAGPQPHLPTHHQRPRGAHIKSPALPLGSWSLS